MARTKLVKPLRNGQITIPKEFREELGLAEDDMLSLSLANGRLQIEVVHARPKVGSPWAKELYEMFAPARDSLAGHSEQEINDAIDEALRAYRAEQG
jgi:AbrB family looped-hinge helix DNA binding protein